LRGWSGSSTCAGSATASIPFVAGECVNVPSAIGRGSIKVSVFNQQSRATTVLVELLWYLLTLSLHASIHALSVFLLQPVQRLDSHCFRGQLVHWRVGDRRQSIGTVQLG
jgi:hypothetical protein